MTGGDDETLGLRERKKRRTREALTDAALALFAERGYERTTVADIAAAADIAPRTFFSYFPNKEAVLFAGTDQRLELIAAAFADLPDGLEPVNAIRRIVDRIADMADLAGPQRLQRVGALLSDTGLQAMALQRLFTAERLIAEQLRTTYPDRYDDAIARTLSGALVGALVATVLHCAERGYSAERTRTELHRALDLLGPGLNRPAQRR
ncbi:TetR family transcriptional regulator [Tenggerimyces flavus]|uniref:TetR family transcriptional regulator n=1 Tax=Tenggerimyces flavus TaxID=1708749 RepID=A0ABV7YG43_9ACTN|nr:TetR family transcriptional regulator [Tenggerimyces flavus]MBM7789160.1 AcrR family transcriptional regulator [Tenggerimyces flavus]